MEFSRLRFDKLADVSIGVGHIFFASVFIDPLVNGSFGWTKLILGIFCAVSGWSIGVLFVGWKY